MTTGNDKNVGIIIDLLVDAEQFVNQVQNSLNTGKNLIKQQSSQMKQMLDEVFKLKGVDQDVIKRFSTLRDVITKTSKSFAEAGKGGQDLSIGLLKIKNSTSDVTAAWERISAAQKASRQSAEEAARRLVSNGEIEASVAQQALANNGKNLISTEKLQAAFARLGEESLRANRSLKNAFNLDEDIRHAIGLLDNLGQAINRNQTQLTNLTNGAGFKANTAAVPVNKNAGATIQAQATAFGTSPTTAGLDLLKSGQLNVNETIGGLRAIGKGSDALIPTFNQLNKAIAQQRTEYDALNKTVTQVVAERRKEQIATADEADAAEKTNKALREQAAAEQKANQQKEQAARKAKEEADALGQTTAAQLKFNQTMAGTSSQASIFQGRLNGNKKSLDDLKNSTLGWAEASKRAATSVGVEMAKTGAIIQELAARQGVSLTKAAQLGVASGSIELGNAQAYLAGNNEKLMMSEVEATAALRVQEAQLKNGKVAVLSYGDALGKLNIEEGKLSGKPPKVDISKTLKGMVDQVTNLIGKFLLFQYVMQGIGQTFEELNTKFLQFDRSLFTLNAVVASARSQIGAAAGSMTSWGNSIKALQAQFPQFSQKDITGAVASVAKLTAILGLSEDQIKDVIVQAATLSQITGTDLTQATDDLVKALGGSSVVLDKYGIFIRDSDKNQTQLSKSIGKTTDTMTSQELALATLQAVMKQTVPLTAALGDYSSTASGQISKSNAKIEDSLTTLGSVTIQFDIYFKNLYATFLESIIKVLPQFEQLLNIITMTNEQVVIQDRNNKIMTENKINPFAKYQKDSNKSDFELRMAQSAAAANSSYGNVFSTMTKTKFSELSYKDLKIEEYRKVTAEIFALNKQISDELARGGEVGDWEKKRDDLIKKLETEPFTDTKDFLKVSKKFVELMFPNLHGPEFDAKLNEFRNDYIAAYEKVQNIAHPYVENEQRPGQIIFKGKTAANVLSEEEIKAIEKAKEDIAKAVKDKNQAITDAELKLTQDLRDMITDRARAYADLDKSVKSDKDKAKRKGSDSNADALIKYQRDLRDLEAKTQDDRAAKEKEFQDKSEEAWRDYYRSLAELNQGYLFDLRDAVADNDAVAIKRLERKYNLDKLKLDNNLQDKLENQQKDLNKTLQQLKDETDNRKKELDQRYKDELEDIQRGLEIELREIDISKKEEEDKIKESFDRRKDDLTRNLSDEKAQIQTHYDRQLEDIGTKLRSEGQIISAHYGAVFKDMEKYLGKNGDYIKLINGFYDEELRIQKNRADDYSIYDPTFQKWLKDNYNITVPDSWKPSGNKSNPQPRGYMTPDAGIDNPQNVPIKVEFSSDGTIPDQFYQIISERTIDQISNVIGGMVAR